MNWNVHISSSAHLENIKKVAAILSMAMKVKTCCSSEGFSELKHGIFPFLEDKREGDSARPYPNKTTL